MLAGGSMVEVNLGGHTVNVAYIYWSNSFIFTMMGNLISDFRAIPLMIPLVAAIWEVSWKSLEVYTLQTAVSHPSRDPGDWLVEKVVMPEYVYYQYDRHLQGEELLAMLANNLSGTSTVPVLCAEGSRDLDYLAQEGSSLPEETQIAIGVLLPLFAALFQNEGITTKIL